jgi:hypothetical protein
MTAGRWGRYAPLLGALFVILTAIGFLVAGDTPDIDALPAEIKDSYDDEAKHLIGLWLVTLGAVSLLFFGAHLRAALRALHPTGRMANAAFAGAITAATGFMVAAGLHGAITSAVQENEVAGPALQALNTLDNWSFVPFTAGLATLVIATGLAIARAARLIPTWFGWLGVVIGIVGISPLGFFGFLAGGLWVLALSLILYRRWSDLGQGGAGPAPPVTATPA